MSDNIRLEFMTWQEVEKKKDKIIILPVGSIEQHGPHLPLCVDKLLAEEIAVRIAEKIHAVVAPTVAYGYKSKPFSGGGPLFPGTIDLEGPTLIMIIENILSELIADGFTKILIFSAHFENEAFLTEAMDQITKKQNMEVQIGLIHWWDLLTEWMVGEIFCDVPFPGWALEHAAVTETSLMMYLAPDLVRRDKLPQDQIPVIPPPYSVYPVKKGIVPENGVLASAKGASAEKGEQIVNYVLMQIPAMVKEMFDF